MYNRHDYRLQKNIKESSYGRVTSFSIPKFVSNGAKNETTSQEKIIGDDDILYHNNTHFTQAFSPTSSSYSSYSSSLSGSLVSSRSGTPRSINIFSDDKSNDNHTPTTDQIIESLNNLNVPKKNQQRRLHHLTEDAYVGEKKSDENHFFVPKSTENSLQSHSISKENIFWNIYDDGNFEKSTSFYKKDPFSIYDDMIQVSYKIQDDTIDQQIKIIKTSNVYQTLIHVKNKENDGHRTKRTTKKIMIDEFFVVEDDIASCNDMSEKTEKMVSIYTKQEIFISVMDWLTTLVEAYVLFESTSTNTHAGNKSVNDMKRESIMKITLTKLVKNLEDIVSVFDDDQKKRGKDDDDILPFSCVLRYFKMCIKMICGDDLKMLEKQIGIMYSSKFPDYFIKTVSLFCSMSTKRSHDKTKSCERHQNYVINSTYCFDSDDLLVSLLQEGINIKILNLIKSHSTILYYDIIKQKERYREIPIVDGNTGSRQLIINKPTYNTNMNSKNNLSMLPQLTTYRDKLKGILSIKDWSQIISDFDIFRRLMACVWYDIPLCIRRGIMLSATKKIDLEYPDRVKICWYLFSTLFKPLLDNTGEKTTNNNLSHTELCDRMTDVTLKFLETLACESTQNDTSTNKQQNVHIIYSKKKVTSLKTSYKDKIKYLEYTHNSSISGSSSNVKPQKHNEKTHIDKKSIVFESCSTLGNYKNTNNQNNTSVTLDHSKSGGDGNFQAQIFCPFSVKNGAKSVKDEFTWINSVPKSLISDIEDLYMLEKNTINSTEFQYVVQSQVHNSLYKSDISMSSCQDCRSCNIATSNKIRNMNKHKRDNTHSEKQLGMGSNSNKIYTFGNPVESFLNKITM